MCGNNDHLFGRRGLVGQKDLHAPCQASIMNKQHPGKRQRKKNIRPVFSLATKLRKRAFVGEMEAKLYLCGGNDWLSMVFAWFLCNLVATS